MDIPAHPRRKDDTAAVSAGSASFPFSEHIPVVSSKRPVTAEEARPSFRNGNTIVTKPQSISEISVIERILTKTEKKIINPDMFTIESMEEETDKIKQL